MSYQPKQYATRTRRDGDLRQIDRSESTAEALEAQVLRDTGVVCEIRKVEDTLLVHALDYPDWLLARGVLSRLGHTKVFRELNTDAEGRRSHQETGKTL